MKSTKFLFIAIAGFVILGAWTIKPVNEIKKAAWLIGTWESKTPEGNLYETWKQTTDKEFSGKSYMMQAKDTIVFETVRLVQEGNDLFYIPVVKDQNGGLPVRFEAKTVSETQLIFENPKHDFPQIISYTKTGAASLTAEISGKVNGKMERQTFKMTRVK